MFSIKMISSVFIPAIVFSAALKVLAQDLPTPPNTPTSSDKPQSDTMGAIVKPMNKKEAKTACEADAKSGKIKGVDISQCVKEKTGDIKPKK